MSIKHDMSYPLGNNSRRDLATLIHQIFGARFVKKIVIHVLSAKQEEKNSEPTPQHGHFGTATPKDPYA
jgi:hypothetical protein